MVPSEQQVEAVRRALMGMDAGLYSRGGHSDRELIGVIVESLSTASPSKGVAELERAAAALERDRCIAQCARVLDEQAERNAEEASRIAAGTDAEIDRLRHWSTVRTYNAGIRRCLAILKEPV